MAHVRITEGQKTRAPADWLSLEKSEADFGSRGQSFLLEVLTWSPGHLVVSSFFLGTREGLCVQEVTGLQMRDILLSPESPVV